MKQLTKLTLLAALATAPTPSSGGCSRVGLPRGAFEAELAAELVDA